MDEDQKWEQVKCPKCGNTAFELYGLTEGVFAFFLPSTILIKTKCPKCGNAEIIKVSIEVEREEPKKT